MEAAHRSPEPRIDEDSIQSPVQSAIATSTSKPIHLPSSSLVSTTTTPPISSFTNLLEPRPEPYPTMAASLLSRAAAAAAALRGAARPNHLLARASLPKETLLPPLLLLIIIITAATPLAVVNPRRFAAASILLNLMWSSVLARAGSGRVGGARGGGRRWAPVRPVATAGRVRDRGAVQRHVVFVRGVRGHRRPHSAPDGARGVGRVAPRQPQGPRRQGACSSLSVVVSAGLGRSLPGL